MALTEMQQQFVVNKAAGVKNREAAIAAGFSAKSADVQAGRLMGRVDIKKAIAKAKRDMRKGVTEKPDVNEDDLDDGNKKNKMPKSRYADPLDFLTDVMNHKHLPIAMRADAAKQLLPYKHARIAEKGKKETAKDAARKIARGDVGDKTPARKPKFATKTPPTLRTIQGGKV